MNDTGSNRLGRNADATSFPPTAENGDHFVMNGEQDIGNQNGTRQEDVVAPPEVGHQIFAKTSSVWFTAQTSRSAQRDRTRYVPDSFAHPGKMLPDLARTILDTYGRTGDLWCDPMCGIGTLLVEGVERGYEMFGVEWEPRWQEVCQANLDLAAASQAPGVGHVVLGDSRNLSDLFVGVAFDKICFSPPYGNTLSKRAHGRDLHPERQLGGKRGARAIRHGYGFQGTEHEPVADEPGEMTTLNGNELNIGELSHGNMRDALQVAAMLSRGEQPTGIRRTFLTEMARIYHQCHQRLRDNGLLILVLRDYRRGNRRIDLLGDTLGICTTLGFGYYDRLAAIQCPVSMSPEGIKVKPEGYSAFWTLYNASRSNPPWMVPVFEDVIVLIKERRRRLR